MNKIITKIERKPGFDYKVDKNGQIIESKYNWFKDRNTLVMLVILLLGGLYYAQMSQSATNAENFEEYCMIYYNLRDEFVINNPSMEISLGNILEYHNNKGDLSMDKNG